ncbi:MAG: hypothetical protein LBP55_08485 [Candidatus Adiutrix sp.]|jgi:hypothetical protein|nr:hypothetical protein [Candidatus Adiutrix sp.]
MEVITLVNRALAKLGEGRINSLSDPGRAATLAASLYDSLRDAETAAHAWHFAKARGRLPAEAARPAFGWSFQYLLPADCLRLMWAGPRPGPDRSGFLTGEDRPYALEGGRILTHLPPPLTVLYLRRVTEAAEYPAAFAEALAARLAAEMAESLTGSQARREAAWAEYERAARQARRLNALSLPPQMAADDTWLAAHWDGVI